MSKTLKWIIIISIVGLSVFIGFAYVVGSIFDVGDGKFYSKDDLIKNYKNKQTSIYQLKDFYNNLVPNDKIVEIEFSSDKEIARLAVTNLKSTSHNFNDQYFCDWNLDTNSYKVDSIIRSLGWTQTTLTNIKLKLDKANCIGVINGEPTNIWFQRSGFGMYSYNLFSKAIPVAVENCLIIWYCCRQMTASILAITCSFSFSTKVKKQYCLS